MFICLLVATLKAFKAWFPTHLYYFRPTSVEPRFRLTTHRPRISYPVLSHTKEILDPKPMECKENEHVAFLKTYKTGSETISGILRRFALLRNLSSAISVGPGGTSPSSQLLTVTKLLYFRLGRSVLTYLSCQVTVLYNIYYIAQLII